MTDPKIRETASDRSDVAFKSFALAAAVTAYCVQPALRFVDPDKFMGAAGFVAGGIMWTYGDIARKTWNGWSWFGVVMFFGGLLFLGGVTVSAGNNSRFNDARCRVLEADMLKITPRRADSASLYQALGCRPQTRAAIQFLVKKP